MREQLLGLASELIQASLSIKTASDRHANILATDFPTYRAAVAGTFSEYHAIMLRSAAMQLKTSLAILEAIQASNLALAAILQAQPGSGGPKVAKK